MRYAEADYIDIVATRTEGAAASWLSHEQLAIERRTRTPWRSWENFRDEMVRAFEPTTDEAMARHQMAALKQTGKIAGYIQRFREIRGRIQDMSEQDEFAAFVRGLQPRIRSQVGTLVETDLAAAMRLAARVEMWSQAETSAGGSGSGSGGSGKGKGKGGGQAQHGQEPKKAAVRAVEDSVAVVEQGGKKKKRNGGGKNKKKGGSDTAPKCWACGSEKHRLSECPRWKQLDKKPGN